MPSKDEIFYAAYTEYKDWDKAAEILEHEEQEEELQQMQEPESYSQITTRSLDTSAIHKREERNVVLRIQGYGYAHRQPSFDVNSNSVNLYLSVQEASEMAAKLLEHVTRLQEQEAS